MRPRSRPRFAVSAISFAIVLGFGVQDAGRPVSAAAKTAAQLAQECGEITRRLNGSGSEPSLENQIRDLKEMAEELSSAQREDRKQLDLYTMDELHTSVAIASGERVGGMDSTKQVVALNDYYRDMVAHYKKRIALRTEFQRSMRAVLTSMDRQRDVLVKRRRENNCLYSGSGVVADPFRNVSGDWELEWTWTVTRVRFRGPLRGSGWSLNFEGTLQGGGGNQIWQPAAGSGRATCLLSTPPGAKPHLHCDAMLNQGHQDQNGAWVADKWSGDADGDLGNTVAYGDLNVRLSFKGSGTGAGSDGKRVEVNALNLSPIH
jgi:hypothetical protein